MLPIKWLNTTHCPTGHQTQFAERRATQLAAQHIMHPIMPLAAYSPSQYAAQRAAQRTCHQTQMLPIR